MTTDPARHFTEVTARRHVRFDVLLREVLCDPNTLSPAQQNTIEEAPKDSDLPSGMAPPAPAADEAGPSPDL